jgi:hypothetical protein
MALSPAASHHRGRIAGLSRAIRNGERPADDPEIIDARRALRAERLADHVQQVIAEWPPLTDGQLARVAALLITGANGGPDAP